MTRLRWIRLLVIWCLLLGRLGLLERSTALLASDWQVLQIRNDVVAASESGATLGFAVRSDPPFNPQRPALVGHGDFITYTFLLSNTSAVTVSDINVINAVPLGAHSVVNRFVPSPQQTQPIVWKVDSLAVGQVITLQHVVQVNLDITVTAIVNTAVMSSPATSVLTQTTVHPFGAISAPQLALYMPLAMQAH